MGVTVMAALPDRDELRLCIVWASANRSTIQRRHTTLWRHQEQILEALPSLSFPDAELLIVVRPNDTDLYEYLLSRFAGVRGVKGNSGTSPHAGGRWQ